ncbi:MAG TPA: amino acid racemase [Candidatus Olsenella excrementavium]|uniref:Amino acid racemase n=1 Tax=Candidatus Olsenella excrementavium TaxID=2838709 RepID=A0A9D1ZFI2_9ACTN|nr:amino acid racemase [Candidatus Olsenella excrementavium]
MGKLGVIGGMGPEATAFFYEEVIKHTNASRDQEHLDMVIISQASMPDRTHAIITGDDARLIQVMREDAQALETLGCTCIAIPCNTSHYFYDKIQSFTGVPIIHMPREAVREAAQARRARRIGIMGTDGTVRSGVYARECEALGIECMVPSPERQADVMSIIYENVKAGHPADMGKFSLVVDELVRRGCDAIILACTELSVVRRRQGAPDVCLDAMDVLVREAIERSGKLYRA